MRVWPIAIAAATAAACACGCAAEDEDGTRVIDRVTGAPVVGASVHVVASGVVEVAAPGYLTMRVAVGPESAPVRMFPVATSDADDTRLSQRYAGRPQAAGDLRPVARALLERLDARREAVTSLADVAELLPARARSLPTTPATIRIWRRGLDGSATSCTGRVDVMAFDAYVKGVLPHEWIPSWDARALRMGAVAVRSYAAAWVAAGGKYVCADLDDTTASQVYRDETLARTDAAVDATAGMLIVKNGALVLAEYSAENGDPTATGVAEPHCTGHAVNGHGRGACQWGTQRWALGEGKDYDWMTTHYYPGAELVQPPPAYAAAPAGESYAATMTSGDEVVAWLDFANTGTATWDVAATQVATTLPRERASVFYKDGDWLSPSRPSAADAAGAGPGAVGRFSFVMKAPEVAVPTTFVEHFGLVQEGQTWFAMEDSLVTWTINVLPKNDSAADADAGSSSDDEPTLVSSSPGCSITPGRPYRRHGGGYDLTRTAAMLLLAVAAWKRGRQLVIVGVGGAW